MVDNYIDNVDYTSTTELEKKLNAVNALLETNIDIVVNDNNEPLTTKSYQYCLDIINTLSASADEDLLANVTMPSVEAFNDDRTTRSRLTVAAVEGFVSALNIAKDKVIEFIKALLFEIVRIYRIILKGTKAVKQRLNNTKKLLIANKEEYKKYLSTVRHIDVGHHIKYFVVDGNSPTKSVLASLETFTGMVERTLTKSSLDKMIVEFNKTLEVKTYNRIMKDQGTGEEKLAKMYNDAVTNMRTGIINRYALAAGSEKTRLISRSYLGGFYFSLTNMDVKDKALRKYDIIDFDFDVKQTPSINMVKGTTLESISYNNTMKVIEQLEALIGVIENDFTKANKKAVDVVVGIIEDWQEDIKENANDNKRLVNSRAIKSAATKLAKLQLMVPEKIIKHAISVVFAYNRYIAEACDGIKDQS